MGIPYAVGQVLILVSVGASAKQTGLIPSWLAQAGYVSTLGALIPTKWPSPASCWPWSRC